MTTPDLAITPDVIDNIKFDWHFTSEDQTTVEITYFLIPEDSRRKGVGTQFINDFLVELPTTVQTIYLFAADMGTGRSNEFWESLGFEYEYQCFEEEHADLLGDEAAYTMFKNINGGTNKQVEFNDWIVDFEDDSDEE